MESRFLDWLQKRVRVDRRAPLGLCDDAALLHLAHPERAIVTTDMLMDGVDFCLARTDVRRAGRKALAVNLSDLAAMAASPVAAFVSLALPRKGGLALAEELYEGLFPLADEYDIALAGGDTNSWDGPLAISITVVGEAPCRGPLLRSGGQAGDSIVVTGSFGGSLLGKHLDFSPRVRESLQLNADYTLHAGMDVSDGLSLDLARLAAASGCGAVIDPSRVPISEAAVELSRRHPQEASALERALGDGEDFELLLAVPPDEAERLLRDQPLAVPLAAIGQLVSDSGLWQSSADSPRVPLVPRGYEHRLES